MSGEIERIRLEDLKSYAKNPRRHGKEQIGKIAESISRYGMVQPLVVDKNGTIVIGHGRYEALRLLGEETAPCIRVENLSPKQVRELRVADNRLNEMSSWSDLLVQEVLDLDMGWLDEFKLFDEESGKSASKDDSLSGEASDPNIYQQKIIAPYYEPTGKAVALSECYDDSRYSKLADCIRSLRLQDKKLEEFLLFAAARFVDFNFQKIAEYYSNLTDESMKEVFEELALVIIDKDAAIERGLDALTDELTRIYKEDAKK